MQLISVNLGQEKIIQQGDRLVKTGIFKNPVEGPVRATKLGFERDAVVDTKHHGGPDQAVYIYGAADYDWWSAQLGRDIPAGTFGENLTISEARLKELGAAGFMQPLHVTCLDHEGGGAVKFQQWDGKQWKVITDWIQPDKQLVRGMIETSAAAYAKEKNITPRDCSKEG